jgi:hypothetical protein
MSDDLEHQSSKLPSMRRSLSQNFDSLKMAPCFLLLVIAIIYLQAEKLETVQIRGKFNSTEKLGVSGEFE